ncbi:MAG: ABC transporter permease [Bryobacteraceae bacterium]
MNKTAILAAIGLAMDTIRGHKVRAVLTVLGVVIGTSTIIGVGSIIAGLDGAIAGALSGFGANTVIVLKHPIKFGNLTSEERQRKPLTYENAVAIRERCPSVKAVSPWLFPGDGIHKAKYKGNDYYELDFGGTDDGYAGSDEVRMKSGRFFTEVENLHKAPVVVIGEDIQKALFPEQDPIGKWMDVDGHQFEVVGLMYRPGNAMPGQDDTRVLVPYFTMHKMFPNAKEHMLVVVANEGKLAAATDEVRMVLRQERRVAHSAPDNFGMSTAEQMLDDFRKVTAVTALVMVVLSSIGLLVGGIGVMNIMLVSVTERTKEIGVRKALGARRSDIILQFLTEAVVLTGMGGLVGMLLGWLMSLAVHLAFPNLPTAVPLWAAASGVLMSVAVGLFFGIWPAGKAARLDPVVALRYE